MTVEEFLAGAGETPCERERRIARQGWNAYMVSDEGADEILALMEKDCYDGPTGDA